VSGSECLEEAEAGKRREHKSVLPDVDNFFLVCLVCLRLENCLWEQNHGPFRTDSRCELLNLSC